MRGAQQEKLNGEPDSPNLRMDLGLAAISATTLLLEILQTRIFSYSLDPLTIYLAVGVCLLGLGASATVLAVLPDLSATRARSIAASFAVLGALATPAAHALFAAWAGEVYARTPLGGVTLVVLAVPYFCFGMTTAALLVARSHAIGRAYAFNLAGAALGCAIVYPLLDLLGAEASLVVAAWMSLGTAFLLGLPRSRMLAGAIVGACLLLVQASAATLYDFPPDPRGQLAWIERKASEFVQSNSKARFEIERVYSRWTDTGRAEVWQVNTNVSQFRSRPVETKVFMQDASAGSLLLGVGDDLGRSRTYFEDTIYGAGYVPRPVEDVLVIGLGGAPDVLGALHHGASRIVGVDINEATIDFARDQFREFLGDPYGQPEVETHTMDGRTYLRTTPDRFDLIVMTGVDTKTLLASGSLSLSENYLYTEEALRDVIRHLRDDGVLAVTRFREFVLYRIISAAASALAAESIDDPERSMIVVKQGAWLTLLVQRGSFDGEELDRVHAWVARNSEPPTDLHLPEWDLIGVGLSHPITLRYSPPPRPVAVTGFYRALRDGTVAPYVESASKDLRAATDDRPYLFFETRPERAFTDPPEVLTELLGFAAQLTVASALLILLPLIVLRRRGLVSPASSLSLVYFACIGIGFMLVEIGLFHWFVLLLGHQSFSVTAVLLGLLVGASVGSAFSSWQPFRGRGAASAALAVLVGVLILYSRVLGDVFAAAASSSFASRWLLALATLIPLGVLLGLAFPLGARALRTHNVALVAWAIGVNGFASVLGATLAVPLALVTGLSTLLLGAAALYTIAILTLPISRPG
jgi:SAM-dependent methyltransferase